MKTEQEIKDFEYYHEYPGNKYLQLMDNHTLWKFNNINYDILTEEEKEKASIYQSFDVTYADILEIMTQKFESHFKNVELFCLGRSGRHICVEDTAINRRRYHNLCNYAEKLEQELIDIVTDKLNNYIKEIKEDK